MRLPDCCLAVLASVLAGCAHAPPRPSRAVAVMPVDVFGLPAEQGPRLGEAIEHELLRAEAVHLVPPLKLASVLPVEPAELQRCLSSDACVAGHARKTAADLALVVAVAGLGETRLLRAKLVRADEGVAIQDLQQTVTGQSLELETQALVRRLFPPEVKPLTRQWWFWTAVGLAAGGVTATTWALTRGPPEPIVRLGEL